MIVICLVAYPIVSLMPIAFLDMKGMAGLGMRRHRERRAW
jgi:hypothetical protein